MLSHIFMRALLQNVLLDVKMNRAEKRLNKENADNGVKSMLSLPADVKNLENVYVEHFKDGSKVYHVRDKTN